MTEDSNTSAVIKMVMNEREIALVRRLLVLNADTTLPEDKRQYAAFQAVLDMVSDIPVLNASGALVQPLYAIRRDLRGSVQNGGKDRDHYALQVYAVAFVNILHSEKVLMEDAYKKASQILASNGRAVSAATVKDWRVGENNRWFLGAVRDVEVVIREHMPLTTKKLKGLPGRAEHWFAEQCAAMAIRK